MSSPRSAPPRLIVVTDRHVAASAGRPVVEVIDAALAAGAPAILFRDKDLAPGPRRELGETLAPRVRAAGAQLLVSADPALARHLDADGIHLTSGQPAPPGQRAGPDADATTHADSPWLVGRSCHDQTAVLRARDEGLDHVIVAPVAPPTSKPFAGTALGAGGLARCVAAARGMPVYALGGVTPANVAAWRGAGASGIAVLGAVMGAAAPHVVVRDLLRAWDDAAPRGPDAVSVRPPTTSTQEAR